MVIRRDDRVADVISRNGGVLEALVAASPIFQRLRNPLMRRTMGRLATIEQAARVAGLDPDELVSRLNGVMGGSGAAQCQDDLHADELDKEDDVTRTDGRLPTALAAMGEERILDLDVRENLRNGEEPFSRIMAARREVPSGGVLRLRAIFEPVPLYAVMAKQGFAHWTETFADDDWRVWFYPASPAGSSSGPATAGHATSAANDPGAAGAVGTDGEGERDGDVVILDVRGMEPPEPMVHTLAALENLPAGHTLLQINQRVPQFLLPKLEELGFAHEIREQTSDLVRVFIRRRDH
ncbi:MAG: DUF2249 domain-containing protein [Gemmatimonadota bacterium]